jgi:hypothetical protein
MAWAYAWYGHSDAYDINAKMAAWIRSATGGDPTAIKGGYSRSGSALNNNFVATFAGCLSCAAMVSADNQDFVNRGFTATKNADASSYYNKSIQIITMLTLSGNLTPMMGTAVDMPQLIRPVTKSPGRTFIATVTPFSGRCFFLNGRIGGGIRVSPQGMIPRP